MIYLKMRKSNPEVEREDDILVHLRGFDANLIPTIMGILTYHIEYDQHYTWFEVGEVEQPTEENHYSAPEILTGKLQ